MAFSSVVAAGEHPQGTGLILLVGTRDLPWGAEAGAAAVVLRWRQLLAMMTTCVS